MSSTVQCSPRTLLALLLLYLVHRTLFQIVYLAFLRLYLGNLLARRLVFLLAHDAVRERLVVLA